MALLAKMLAACGNSVFSPRTKVRLCPRSSASAESRKICAGTVRSGARADGKRARSTKRQCVRAPARCVSDRDSRKSGNARAKHRSTPSCARGSARGIPCNARGRHQKRSKYSPRRIAGANASRQDVCRRGRSSVRPGFALVLQVLAQHRSMRGLRQETESNGQPGTIVLLVPLDERP